MKQPSSKIIASTLSCLLAAASSAFAASQTWTNAPVDASWANINNWVGRAVPGDINVTTANTVNADVATFNSPIFGGIGGAGNPIVPDDATVVGGRSRRVLGVTFDTTNCGAYVISSPSPEVAQNGSSPATGILYVSHNGAIRINDSVTNSQAVLIPMYVNLPASTPGVFNLVNNSTNPNVTLTIKSVTHAGATTRATTFILDGTNTFDNVVTNLSEGPGNATGGFTKQGPGTWIIAGTGTFPGASPLNIYNGILAVKVADAFGAATTCNIATNGTLRIDGIALNTATLALRNGGTVRMNGVGSVNAVSVNSAVGTSVNLATTSATDVLTVNGIVSGGAADTVLHLAGPGTIQFGSANTFVGRYSVDSGTNQLVTDALGTAANLNLAAGAVFDVSLLGATTYSLSTKAFSANGSGTGATASTIKADPGATVDFGSKPITLTFTPTAFAGDITHPVVFLSQGTLSFNGNAITVNNASGTPLNAGTYRLVQQATGNIVSSGGFVTLVTGSGLAAGMIGEIVASGGSLNLVVSAYTPKSLVWAGGNPNSDWDRLTTANWLAGATPSTFNIYDSVTFNATGSANPSVNLVATMAPGSVTVDTSANDYTFSSSTGGQIAGGTGLLKIGAGTLNLNTANTYSGGTVISNGTVKIGVDNALPSTGTGDVTNHGTIDLNGFNDTIGALNGTGTVNITGGGTSTLTVGGNDSSGTFSGVLQNSAGTLNLTKIGIGSETLTKSNGYTGTTTVELGTLKATDPGAIGGGVSALVVNGGVFDLATNVNVFSLAGNGGTIANVSTTVTNTLTITGNASTTFAGSIVSGAGKIALRILGGTLRLSANNTYTNGTFIGDGAKLEIHNNPANVPGFVIASNNASLGLSGGSATPGTPASITTVDNGTVTFASGAEGNIWNSQFIGSSTTTNVFTGPQSAGGATSFSNFLGLVRLAVTNGNFRFFNGGGFSGGDRTTFEFVLGNVHTRDAQSVLLGSVQGGTSTSGIGGNGTGGTVSTWIIGGKNLNNSFEGYISGSNNLVKAGSGILTLDGVSVTTNTDSATFTNYLYGPLISYIGSTTVSNGTLVVASPNNLSNSTSIIVASPSAILDATQMGYVSNLISVDDGITPTNSFLVTNGVFEVYPGQTLGGVGVVKAKVIISDGIINPGMSGVLGTLSLSNSVVIHTGATNYFDLAEDPAGIIRPNDMVRVQGDVGLVGSSYVTIAGNPKVGIYPLIKYTGSLTNETGVLGNGSVANLTLAGGLSQFGRATMVLSNAPGELDLVVVSINNLDLTWAGDGVSNWWDVATSFTFTNNNTPIQFFQLDNVFFGNNSTNLSVILQGVLTPTVATVNSSTNYGFGGTGSIGGYSSLIKAGTGSLILTNGANSYYGGTIVSNGILSAGADSGNNQNDLALGTGPVTIYGGELRFGGNGGGTVVHHFITNAITVTGGAVRAQDGAQHLTNSVVTIGSGGGTFLAVFSTKNLILDSPVVGTGNLNIASGGTAGQVIFNNGLNTLSGNVSILTNGNLALVGPAGVSNSPSIDVQQGGILDVTGRTGTLLPIVSGQTLKGNGTVRGRFVTATAGSTVAPGIAGAIGTLTVTNMSATSFSLVTLNGVTAMDINRAATQNSDRIVNANGTNVLGGTLAVNNLGAALQAGDTFQLFVAAANNGAFAVTNLPSLTSGLAWSNSIAVNGRITVVNSVNTTPTNLTFRVNGNNLEISWPADHTGWRLQVQTNPITVGLRSNWVDVAGSTTVNSVTNAINPANDSVFYRMVYP